MASYQIFCGSTVDISEEYLIKRNIGVLKYRYCIDGASYYDDFGKTISFDDFYRMIDEGSQPTTSQPNVEDHIEAFETYLRHGLDILYVYFSSGLSGGFNSAQIAKENLLEKYPERKIELIDSLSASAGYGLLIDMVADERDRGASLADVVAYTEHIRLKIQHWFFSTTLKHYCRGGRISPTAAAIGSVLGICPLLNVDREGRLVPRFKIKGKNAVIKKTLELMTAHAENGTDYSGKCFITESACLQDAQKLASLIEERFPKLNGKVTITSIGTVIGSHTGPGTIALFFFGDERDS